VGRPGRQSLDLSLVVVIGLVLSVSGAVFTAIAAVRSNWHSVVDGHKKDSTDWFDSLEFSEGKINDGYKKYKKRFNRQVGIWDLAKWVPILLLGLVSVLIAIDVLLS